MLQKQIMAAACGLAAIFAFGEIQVDALQKTASAQDQESFSQEDINRLSEAFGHFIGRNLNAPGIKFDVDSIIAGLRNGAAGKPAPMSDQDYEQMMAKLQERAYNQLAEENLKSANTFLSQNAKADNVKEIVPGKLQYQTLKDGTGNSVTEHSAPQVNYVGKYLDGTVFGSSEEAGGPITIPLDQTIPGFSKGILGMKEGEKRKLFVHPDLAYGTVGHLPPNSLLIFEIEVLKANNQEKQKPVAINDAPQQPQKTVFKPSSSSSDSDEDDDDDSDDEDDDEDDEDDDEPVKPTKSYKRY